jgi:hypothetical protein
MVASATAVTRGAIIKSVISNQSFIVAVDRNTACHHSAGDNGHERNFETVFLVHVLTPMLRISLKYTY